MKWKRPTVNADRTFAVECPFFLAAGALHVEDVLELYALNDPLGVRGRLGLFYARPTFKRAREVEAAAVAVAPQRRGLEALLQTKFRSAWHAHDPLHCASPALFEEFKGYRFRVYTLNEAKQHFFRVFDDHTAQHEEAHLTNMSSAKFHSKAKTKFLRHALAVHLSEQARQCLEPQAWGVELPVSALKFGEMLSDYMDKVDSTVAGFLSDLVQKSKKSSEGQGGVPAQGRASVRQQLQQLLNQTLPSYVDLDSATAKVILGVSIAIFKKKAAWIDSSIMLKTPAVKEALQGVENAGEHLHYFARAACLIASVGLGAAGLGTNQHGTPLIFMVKQVLRRDAASFVPYSNVLSAFGLRTANYAALCSDDANVQKPPSAPALTLPRELTLEASTEITTVVTALVAASALA